MHGNSERNWRKTSKGFFSSTTHCIGSKSSLCNLPGKVLQDGVNSVAIQSPIPDIWRKQRKTFKGFFSQMACHIYSKSSLCNSPGEALQDGVSCVAIQSPIPDISGWTDKHTQTDRQTHTHRIRVLLYKIIMIT